MNNKYIITCSTNPYTANKYHEYRGKEIIKWDGATPIKWFHDTNYGNGFSLKEARDKLMSYAQMDSNESGESIRHKYFDLTYESDGYIYRAEKCNPSGV